MRTLFVMMIFAGNTSEIYKNRRFITTSTTAKREDITPLGHHAPKKRDYAPRACRTPSRSNVTLENGASQSCKIVRKKICRPIS